MRLPCFVLLLLLSLPVSLRAQTCERPQPFGRTSQIGGSFAFVDGAGPTCDLTASGLATGLTPSGAFAWYSVPGLSTTYRISFRLDTSQLSEDTVIDGVEILAVTSRHPAPASYGNVLVHVGLVGAGKNDPTTAYVSYLAFCGSCPDQTAVGVFPPIVNGDRLGFEINIGAGAQGSFRYWQNASFSDPPTYSREGLDNGALLGARDVALGAFNISTRLASVGTTLRFSEIQTSDDVISWSDFDE